MYSHMHGISGSIMKNGFPHEAFTLPVELEVVKLEADVRAGRGCGFHDDLQDGDECVVVPRVARHKGD